jgi:hypothetical protein
VSERDTQIRRAKATRAWGRASATRWNFPADEGSRVGIVPKSGVHPLVGCAERSATHQRARLCDWCVARTLQKKGRCPTLHALTPRTLPRVKTRLASSCRASSSRTPKTGLRDRCRAVPPRIPQSAIDALAVSALPQSLRSPILPSRSDISSNSSRPSNPQSLSQASRSSQPRLKTQSRRPGAVGSIEPT